MVEKYSNVRKKDISQEYETEPNGKREGRNRIKEIEKKKAGRQST